MNMKKLLKLTALLLVITVVVAACDKNDDGDNNTDPTQTEKPTPTPTPDPDPDPDPTPTPGMEVTFKGETWKADPSTIRGEYRMDKLTLMLEAYKTPAPSFPRVVLQVPDMEGEYNVSVSHYIRYYEKRSWEQTVGGVEYKDLSDWTQEQEEGKFTVTAINLNFRTLTCTYEGEVWNQYDNEKNGAELEILPIKVVITDIEYN